MRQKLKLYNTLTKTLEVFTHIDDKKIKMYVCGPTVYDYAHIGNARSVVVYDTLYRLLSHLYGMENIVYVRNITDIDDKIIIRAKELNCSIMQLTSETISYFHEHMRYLNCLSPSFEPKATEHLNEMFQIIQMLIEQDFAYISGNHVYFDVLKYSNYTKLSGRSLDELDPGARIDIDLNKKNPCDFVLWKPAENLSDRTINFDSPWGLGRPGWHIECSAMSYKYLGENFDIHGGGADLIFPHHTNEIAQSKCAFKNSGFANFWIHNGFLTVNGEKMSKSLGNFITVKDLIDKGLKGEVIRLFLMSGKYRQPLDYNDKAISDAQKTLDYWYGALEKARYKSLTTENRALNNEFLNALLDNMNTPLAIKIINDYAKQIHTDNNLDDNNTILENFIACANFVGLLKFSYKDWFEVKNLESKVKELIELRQKAKQEKNWDLADKIRAELLEQDIKIEDKSDGSSFVRRV